MQLAEALNECELRDECDGLWAAVDPSPAKNRGGTGRGFLGACQRFVDSPRDNLELCSGCNGMSPPLLARLHDFAHVPCRPNLERGAERQSRMLADELDSMIHVTRLKGENAAELGLDFRIWGLGIRAVGR